MIVICSLFSINAEVFSEHIARKTDNMLPCLRFRFFEGEKHVTVNLSIEQE